MKTNLKIWINSSLKLFIAESRNLNKKRRRRKAKEKRMKKQMKMKKNNRNLRDRSINYFKLIRSIIIQRIRNPLKPKMKNKRR